MRVTNYDTNVFIELSAADAKVLIGFLQKQIVDNRIAKLTCKRLDNDNKRIGKVDFIVL